MKNLISLRQSLCDFLKSVRKKNQWTQQKMSELLDLSQSRYSEIEQGKGSLTAEQFLVLLKTFNLTLSDLNPTETPNDINELHNTVKRLGAFHLPLLTQPTLSKHLYDVIGVIQEVLVRAPSNLLVTSLAPVIVRHVHQLNLDAIGMKLYDLGIDGRLWWLVEGTLWAVRDRQKWFLSREWNEIYKNAAEMLTLRSKAANLFFSLRKAYPTDILDTTITNQKEFEKVKNSRDALASRWRLITKIRTEDFVTTLEAAEKEAKEPVTSFCS